MKASQRDVIAWNAEVLQMGDDEIGSIFTTSKGHKLDLTSERQCSPLKENYDGYKNDRYPDETDSM